MNEIQELKDEVHELEAKLAEFQRRIEPGIKLYEALVPFGIDRYMNPLIRAFAKQYEAGENGKQQASIWNLKWARWAAITGIAFIVLQVLMLMAVAYNTFFGLHTVGIQN